MLMFIMTSARRIRPTTMPWARCLPGPRRVASQALGGEVLVSNLVRELVANSGVEFTESRDVELKGLDGAHRLFAVDLTGP